MMITQTLLQCERCSVLLVDPTSKVQHIGDLDVCLKLFCDKKKKNEIKDISGFMKAMSLLCTQPPIFDFAIPKGLKITLSDEIIDKSKKRRIRE